MRAMTPGEEQQLDAYLDRKAELADQRAQHDADQAEDYLLRTEPPEREGPPTRGNFADPYAGLR